MSEKIQYENGVPTPFPSPAKIMIDSKNLDEVSTPTSSQKDLHEESKLQVPERKRSTTLRNAINKIKGGELISSHKLPKHQSMERENPDSEAKKGVINTIFRRKRKDTHDGEDNDSASTYSTRSTSPQTFQENSNQIKEDTSSEFQSPDAQTPSSQSPDVQIPELNNTKSILQEQPKVVEKKKKPKIETPYRLPGEERFVSYFFTVGIDPSLELIEPRQLETIPNPLQRYYKADLIDCFPPPNDEDPLPPHLSMFCLPDGLKLEDKEFPSITFPFILTTGDGRKMYGYNLTFYEPLSEEASKKLIFPPKETRPNVIYTPKCICVLSHYPFYSVFREWLTEIHKKVFLFPSELSIESYIINFIMEIPLPPPRNIKIKFSIGDKQKFITRPTIDGFALTDFPFYYLFKTLGISNFLLLFKCALLEQRILFYSSYYTLLTWSCETLRTLLYPFQWPHVYVPILPRILTEFTYSPTPYIMGIHSTFLDNRLIEGIRDDVVLVDLDNNRIHVSTELVDLPEPQYTQLLNDLQHFFNLDILSLDSPSFNPYGNTSKPNHALMEGNEFIQCSFLKFFVSLFYDYRNYLEYVRVFSEPIAIFNAEKYLIKKQHKFFQQIVETQAFSSFLDERNWPKANIFDDWINKQIFKLSTEEILSKHSPYAKSKEKFAEIVEAPVPKGITSTPKKHTTFPHLSESLLQPAWGIIPAKVKQDAPAVRFTYEETTIEEIPVSIPKFDSHKEERKKLEDILSLFMLCSKHNKCLDSQDLTTILDLLKLGFSRQFFSETLLKSGKVCINNECFSQLVEMISTALREAYLNSDFESAGNLVHVAFSFYKIEHGAEAFIYTRLLKQDIWQKQEFWEKFLLRILSNKCKQLYSGNIRGKLESWINSKFSQKEKDEFVQKEHDILFDTFSSFCYNMVNLGVDHDLIRRFMLKMSQVTNMDDKNTKIIMTLLSNMTRASELEDKRLYEDFDSKLPVIPTKRSEYIRGYLPVGFKGHHSAQNNFQEGKEMFENFLEEKGAKIENTKTKHTYKTSWLLQRKPRARSAQVAAAEFREDYTVKTFIGHTEGVLCIACDPTTVYSGSCDGTIKLWNPLTTQINGTLTGHSGWVNVIKLDPEGGKILSGSYDRTAKIWDIVNQTKLHSLRGHKGSISSINFLGDKNLVLLSSYDNTLSLWDIRQTMGHRKWISQWTGHTAPVMCVSISKQNNFRVVSGSRDTTLRVWDLRIGKTMKVLKGHSDWVKCCQLDGETIISGSSDGTIRYWVFDNDNNEIKQNTLQGHKGSINGLCVLPNSSLLSASADGTTGMWNLKSGTLATSLLGHSDEVVDCQPFQKGVVTGSYDSTLRIWDMSRSTPLCLSTLFGHQFRISAISVFENKILSASWDKTVKLWEFPQDFRPTIN